MPAIRGKGRQMFADGAGVRIMMERRDGKEEAVITIVWTATF